MLKWSSGIANVDILFDSSYYSFQGVKSGKRLRKEEDSADKIINRLHHNWEGCSANAVENEK